MSIIEEDYAIGSNPVTASCVSSPIAAALQNPISPVKVLAQPEQAMTPRILCPFDFRSSSLENMIEGACNSFLVNTAVSACLGSVDVTSTRSGWCSPANGELMPALRLPTKNHLGQVPVVGMNLCELKSQLASNLEKERI